MKVAKMKKMLYVLLSVVTLSTVSWSCSKDDKVEERGANNHYKITVSLDNVNPDRDYVSVTAVGGTLTSKTDVWKVNGKVMTGESAVSLDKNDFVGATKTYIIETSEPIRVFTNSVQIINYGESLSLRYKIEKGNEVVVNEEITLSGDGADFTKQYSF